MSLTRISAGLIAGVLIVKLGLPAFAQDLQDAQLFAPAELRPYGNGIQPHEGFFFTFDGLHWSISRPEVTTIGKPNFVRKGRLLGGGGFSGVFVSDATRLNPPSLQHGNTHDTGELQAIFKSGNRAEFGRVYGHRGWMVSTYRLNDQSQSFVASSVNVAIDDGPIGTGDTMFGTDDDIFALDGLVESLDPADPTATVSVIRPLPVFFDEMIVKNRVEHWSVELMWMQRFHQCHNGGIFELFAGARYMEFDDLFEVSGRGAEPIAAAATPPPPPAVAAILPTPNSLRNSDWATMAENHIVGPQIGLRYFRQRNRWTFSTEGRFLAGFNSQNIRQKGILGSENTIPGVADRPYLLGSVDVDHTTFLDEFSPAIELRIQGRYQLTRSVSLRGGWTFLWMDHIARASNMVNYEIIPGVAGNPNPSMLGILADENRQDVLVLGANFGFEINR